MNISDFFLPDYHIFKALGLHEPKCSANWDVSHFFVHRLVEIRKVVKLEDNFLTSSLYGGNGIRKKYF